MNTTKLTIQFGLILIIAVVALYFSREIQKEELAVKAAKKVEPIVQRVELNLGEDDNEVQKSATDVNNQPLKTLKNQNLTIITEEDLEPFINARHLDLSGNQLTDLPRFLLKMPYLEELTLDNNNFESIPYFLRHCKRLEEIRINKNPLTSIGLNLWKMKQLKALQLENTAFQKLPKFPDRPDFVVILPERDYSNIRKEKLRNYLGKKYKYTLFELF